MRMAHGHDVIAPATGPFQSRHRGACDPNRWMRLLYRPWVQGYFVKAPELPLVIETLAAPRLENNFQRFLHSLLPFFSLEVEHLIVQRRISGPDTELQSAA